MAPRWPCAHEIRNLGTSARVDLGVAHRSKTGLLPRTISVAHLQHDSRTKHGSLAGHSGRLGGGDDSCTPRLQRTVDSSRFRNVVSAVIFASAVQMGLHTEFGDSLAHHALEHVFTLVFVAEMVLMILVHRLRYFTKSGNLFDFMVAWVSFLDVWVLPRLAQISETRFEAVRIFRVLRLFRVLRVMKAIPELRMVVEGIVGSIRALFWVMILFVLVVYTFSVFFVEIVGTPDDIYPGYNSTSEGILSSTSFQNFNNFEYFGSLRRSMVTLMSISLLAEWDAFRPVWEYQGWVIVVYMTLIFFTSFGIVNVIVGVIVERTNKCMEEMQKMEEDELLEHRARSIRSMADAIWSMDADGNGTLSRQEMRSMAKRGDVLPYLKGMDLPKGFTFDDLFDTTNIDGSGEITLQGFTDCMDRLLYATEFQRTCLFMCGMGQIKLLQREGIADLHQDMRDQFAALNSRPRTEGDVRTSDAEPDRSTESATGKDLESVERTDLSSLHEAIRNLCTRLQLEADARASIGREAEGLRDGVMHELSGFREELGLLSLRLPGPHEPASSSPEEQAETLRELVREASADVRASIGREAEGLRGDVTHELSGLREEFGRLSLRRRDGRQDEPPPSLRPLGEDAEALRELVREAEALHAELRVLSAHLQTLGTPPPATPGRAANSPEARADEGGAGAGECSQRNSTSPISGSRCPELHARLGERTSGGGLDDGAGHSPGARLQCVYHSGPLPTGAEVESSQCGLRPTEAVGLTSGDRGDIATSCAYPPALAHPPTAARLEDDSAKEDDDDNDDSGAADAKQVAVERSSCGAGSSRALGHGGEITVDELVLTFGDPDDPPCLGSRALLHFESVGPSKGSDSEDPAVIVGAPRVEMESEGSEARQCTSAAVEHFNESLPAVGSPRPAPGKPGHPFRRRRIV